MEAETTTKRTWRLVLAYDGTDFYGWQVQPGFRTVQGELSAAIERITGEQVLPQGSGRTDSGVHALAQVASFQMSAPIPEENLARALNRTLPAAIRVIEARQMPESFHARHSARGKTYEYRVFRGNLCPPWLARYVYVYDLRQPLDIAAMQQAAQTVLGVHDFTSFAATDPELARRNPEESSTRAVVATEAGPSGNVRTIYESSWTLQKSDGPEFALADAPVSDAQPPGTNSPGGDLLLYRVRGSGFLHHMVRNLVGTFLDVGRGSLAVEALPEILASRARASAGPTAPASGLFLTKVDY